jgi:predicted  nucleic acid-binding Zn-ribbon protein
MQKQLEAMQKQLEAMQKQLEAMQKQLESTQQQLQAMQKQREAIQKHLESTQKKIRSFSGRMACRVTDKKNVKFCHFSDWLKISQSESRKKISILIGRTPANQI